MHLDYDLKKALTPNRLSGLWRLMTGFRWQYLGANAAMAVAMLARTGMYMLLRYFADDAFKTANLTETLIFIALGFIGLAAAEGGFTFLSGRLAARVSEGVARRVRNYVFDHLQRLSFTYHDQNQTGELIQRSTSDVDAVRRFYADQAIGIGRIFLLFVINLLVLLNLNARLALTSILFIPLILAISIFFFRKVSKVYEEFQEQEAVLSTTLQENLSGVRVVKAFARQKYEMDKFEKDNWKKFLKGKHLLTLHSLFWPISDTLCGLQLILGYLYGALLVMDSQMTIGAYMAYLGLVTALIYPIRDLGRLVVQMSSGLVSFQRVMDMVKEDREPLEAGDYRPDHAATGHINFENVSFGYEKNHPVLENINFECKPGQVIALLGSTGSGKTTLVNLLPRFYEYTSGKILLDGVELNRYPRSYLRSQIGIVEQEPFLFSRSIRENIMYGVGREVSQEEIEAAAKAAAIHDVILTLKDGYATIVGEKGVTLSGGQKQRVAIARTLLKNPRILIMDDSTSAIDTETEAEIRGALQNLMQNRTTFIIAHRIQSIMNADRILVMDHGCIIQSGTHDTLVNEDGAYRRIYDLQTRIETELEKELQNA